MGLTATENGADLESEQSSICEAILKIVSFDKVKIVRESSRMCNMELIVTEHGA